MTLQHTKLNASLLFLLNELRQIIDYSLNILFICSIADFSEIEMSLFDQKLFELAGKTKLIQTKLTCLTSVLAQLTFPIVIVQEMGLSAGFCISLSYVLHALISVSTQKYTIIIFMLFHLFEYSIVTQTC